MEIWSLVYAIYLLAGSVASWHILRSYFSEECLVCWLLPSHPVKVCSLIFNCFAYITLNEIIHLKCFYSQHAWYVFILSFLNMWFVYNFFLFRLSSCCGRSCNNCQILCPGFFFFHLSVYCRALSHCDKVRKSLCHFISFHFISCHVYVMSRHVTSRYVISSHLMSLSCLVVSRHVILRRASPRHVKSPQVTSCHARSRHLTSRVTKAMSCDMMSYDVIWCHVMSYYDVLRYVFVMYIYMKEAGIGTSQR